MEIQIFDWTISFYLRRKEKPVVSPTQPEPPGFYTLVNGGQIHRCNLDQAIYFVRVLGWQPVNKTEAEALSRASRGESEQGQYHPTRPGVYIG
jgi:hypothetical protein